MAKQNKYNQEATSFPDLLGKLPPQALDLEEAVLGAALLERDGCVALLAQITNSEVFYSEKHKIIFEAIQEIRANGEPVDLLTVTNQLRTVGHIESVGGPVAIMGLTTKVNSAANIQTHIRIVLEKWIKRELIQMASVIHARAFDQTSDVFELLEEAQTKLINVQGQLSKKEARSVAQIFPEVLQQWEKAHNTPNGVTGIPTGIAAVDRNSGGLKKGEVTTVGARPGMGKTALIVQIMWNCIRLAKEKVIVFSLEMKDTEIVGRLIVRETEIQKKRLTNGDYSVEEIKEKAKGVLSNAVFIDDSSALTIGMIRAKASAMKMKHKIGLIIIDYLQLTKGNSKTGYREQEISEISRGMKELAKELDVPVLDLSQLSRKVEERQSKRPMLSDLRESGSIEQDSDNVWFLYRPEYYGVKTEIDAENNEYDTAGKCEIIIAKQRDGQTGEIVVNCNIGLNKFWTEEEPVEQKTTNWGPNNFDSQSGDVF